MVVRAASPSAAKSRGRGRDAMLVKGVTIVDAHMGEVMEFESRSSWTERLGNCVCFYVRVPRACCCSTSIGECRNCVCVCSPGVTRYISLRLPLWRGVSGVTIGHSALTISLHSALSHWLAVAH